MTIQIGDRVKVRAPALRPTQGLLGTVEDEGFVEGWLRVRLDKRFKTRQRYMYHVDELEKIMVDTN
jgi:hypothetical protein